VTFMGVFSAMIPSPIYSLPPELLKHDNLGLGFGVISTCSSIGLFIAPYLIGKAKDLTGSYGFSFVFISLFFLLTVISIFFRTASSETVRSSELGVRSEVPRSSRSDRRGSCRLKTQNKNSLPKKP
jgi:MFS family permease